MRSSVVWHPFTQMRGVESFPEVRSAQADRLTLKDGTTLIDAISSWWVITHGHCHPDIMKAIRDQTRKLDQVIFAGFTHRGAEMLAAALVEMTPPKLTRVFFSDDGSTAVEVALKMALQACKQRGEPQRKLFLAFDCAYHGDTVGAMSVGGEGIFTQSYKHLLFQVVRAGHPTHSQAPVSAYLEDFLSKLETYGHQLAGVVVEPLIQGAGGMIMWPPAAVEEIVLRSQALGIPVIFDEVMTGFGRTGEIFAMDHLAVAPDLVCLSKGLTGGALPLAVTLASEEIYEAFLSEDRHQTFFHGHSFTANPIACAAANASLALIQNPEVRDAWARINSVHRERLAGIKYGEILEDSRCFGTVAAVEIKAPKSGYLAPIGPALYQHAFSQGVLLRPLGNVLYLLPPYCMDLGTLHRVWDVLESCLGLARKTNG